MNRYIRGMLLRPGDNEGYLIDVAVEKKDDVLRSIVGGHIETLPFWNSPLLLIINEDGRRLKLEGNGLACDIYVKVCEAKNFRLDELLSYSAAWAILGNAVIFRTNGEEMASLTEEDINIITGPKDNGDEEMSWSGFALHPKVQRFNRSDI